MNKVPPDLVSMRSLSTRIAPPKVRAAAAEMFANGLGHVRVARQLGLSPNTVRDWLREYRAGRFRVDVSTNQRHYSPEVKSAVIELRRAGMTIEFIQKETGISRGTVVKWLLTDDKARKKE